MIERPSEELWGQFPVGVRVEIMTTDGIWRIGTVRETPKTNVGFLIIECDDAFHPNDALYKGKGVVLPVATNTTQNFRTQIRMAGSM